MKFYRDLRLINHIIFLGFIFFAFASGQQVISPELKLAENYLRAGNYQAALSMYKNQYAKGNDSSPVVEGIGRCYKELNLFDNWISFLKDVIKKHPTIFNYAINLGRAYYFNEQADSALNTWQAVYKVEPPQLMRFRLVAQAMTEFRLLDEAIAVYKHALKLPGQELIHLDIGNLYRAQLNYEKATEHYLAYFKLFKKQGALIRSLIINMAKTEEATDRIINHIELLNDDSDAELSELLANLYMRQKNYSKAFTIIVDIEKKLTDNNFNYLNRFALEASKDKAFEYVIKAIDFLKKENPQNNPSVEYKLAYAHYQFAINLFDQQKFNEADTHIKIALAGLKILQESNSPEQANAQELSGDIYRIHFNDLDKALHYYKSIQLNRIGINNADRALLKMANVYILKNDLETAALTLKKIKSNKYLNIALFNLGELYYFKAQYSQAKNAFSDLIAKIGMKDSLTNNVLDRLFEIDRFASDSVSFSKYTEAKLLKRQQKFSQAAEQMEELYFLNKAISLKAGLEAADMYNFLDKKPESNRLLEDIILTHKKAEEIDFAYFMLADNYHEQKDYSKSLALYQEILTRFPTSFYTEQARGKAREINTLLQKTINQ